MLTEEARRIELTDGWRLIRDDETQLTGAELSGAPEVRAGIAIPRMPATILRALSDAGMTGDLATGDGLARVERDLWEHDWWYHTQFEAPLGPERFALAFDGITYRAEVWVNGSRVAGTEEIVGTYRRFELDITRLIRAGSTNTLAVRVVPERRTPGLTLSDVIQEGEPAGVDLADTWADWINFAYHGDSEARASFLPDKNSGIVQRVWLLCSGPVTLRNPYVRTELPLPLLDQAELTVHVDVANTSNEAVNGVLRTRIAQRGRDAIKIDVDVSLAAGEVREITLTPDDHPQLVVEHPELWWPYTWGEPVLHRLDLEFEIGSSSSDRAGCDFGIRQVTGHRDDTATHPEFSDPSSFYLTINGRDYLVRGGGYTPDLLLTIDPDRTRTTMRYAKDLGVNLLRWEGHFLDDGMLELADREGMPTMFGLMCCGAWERWGMWDTEDHQVARASVRDSVRRLRSHASVVLWSNGSDGLPPDEVLEGYRAELTDAHWQSPVIDTASTRNRDWSGVHMNGPYAWRSPAFWFDPDNATALGSVLEEGNDETVPILATLERFLPPEAHWPFNEIWAMHASSAPGNNQLAGIREVIDRRYGSAESLADFAAKAQLAQYESARALFEAYGSRGWRTHKMTCYWMLNAAWPSFFGQLFDYYYAAGGSYFGAKKALRPVSAVFDSFATGDRSRGYARLVNHSTDALTDVTVAARIYSADGALITRIDSPLLTCDSASVVDALVVPRPDNTHPLFFVRLSITDADGRSLAENTYWHSSRDDIPDLRVVDGVFDAMRVRQTDWADFTSLSAMPAVELISTCDESNAGDATRRFRIRLHNPTSHIAFFVRVQLCDENRQELLPITYSDNYVTVYPGESIEVTAEVEEHLLGGAAPVLTTTAALPASSAEPSTPPLSHKGDTQ